MNRISMLHFELNKFGGMNLRDCNLSAFLLFSSAGEVSLAAFSVPVVGHYGYYKVKQAFQKQAEERKRCDDHWGVQPRADILHTYGVLWVCIP